MAESSLQPDVSELLAHADWLQRLARSVTRDDAAAEDLVQDTWLTALRSGPRDGDRARPWLARVLQNRLRSVERSKKRRDRREAEVAPPEALPSTAALSERAESARLLLEAVLELPEAQRQVLLLSYFEGLSVARIAALTESSDVAVRSRITRAVAALRERLDQRSGGDRAHWLQALVPLARLHRVDPTVTTAALTPAALLGSLTMTTFSKIVAAGAALVILGLGFRALQRTELERDEGPADEPVGALEIIQSASPDSATSNVTGTPELASTLPTRSAQMPPPSSSAPVRGVLVDAESGDPIPYYALGIGSGEAEPYMGVPEEKPPFAERVTTDHEGRFQTGAAFEAGAMHAVLLEEFDRVHAQVAARLSVDHARPALAFEHLPASGEGLRLALAMGPSYFVQCNALTVDSRTEFIAYLKSEDPSRTTFAAAALVSATGPQGQVFLARFPPVNREWRMPDEARFELLHVGQRRAGRVVTSTRKVWPYPTIRVDLVSIGTLVVRVDADQGEPPDSVQLDVWRGAIAASELDNRPVVIAGQVAARGVDETLFERPSQSEWTPRLSARHLETGPYTIRLSADGFDDRIEVHTLEEVPNELVCTMHRNVLADGWIAGTVHTDSGAAPAERWVVYLQRKDPKRRAQPKCAAVEVAEEGGRWVGHFRAEGLVPGNYDVWITPAPQVRGARAHPEPSVRQLGVAVGREDLHFDIHDEARNYVLEVTVVDGRDKAPVSDFELTLVKKEKESSIEIDSRSFADGLARLELTSDPSNGLVGIAARGFAVEYQLVPAVADQDGVFRLQLRLHDGWAAPVHALALIDGKPMPIAEAELLADGSVAGRTDERGFCVVRLATRPTTLVARRAGYILERCSGPIDAAGQLGTPRAEPFRERFAFILRPE
jgi:RNA polymerase sigma-70 factor (ECF subfamily)